MLRSISTNISIITNFGCNNNCWYCVWKNHPLRNTGYPTDWDTLEKFLTENKNKLKVSVSGGGDPLYNYYYASSWWDRLFRITDKLELAVDIHTREKLTCEIFWKRINRCVFSSDNLADDIFFLRKLRYMTKIRITHVVTKETTEQMIGEYLQFANEINCQFTIKELAGYSDGGMYKYLCEKYPGVFHLDYADYNLYYMPDNTVQQKFLLNTEKEKHD